MRYAQWPQEVANGPDSTAELDPNAENRADGAVRTRAGTGGGQTTAGISGSAAPAKLAEFVPSTLTGQA